MNGCPTRDELSDLLDGALPLPRRLALRFHLRQCLVCSGILSGERVLVDSAETYMAVVQAPNQMRRRVLAAPERQPVASPRPVFFAKCATFTVLAAALAITGVQLRAPARGNLAYAAVEASMRKIHTAQWVGHEVEYDSVTGKVRHRTVRRWARMDPPAMRIEYLGMPVVFIVPGPATAHRGARTAASLKPFILTELVAPTVPGVFRLPWKSRVVTRDGRKLWRFDEVLELGGKLELAELIKRGEIENVRMKRPGWRRTLWVDPGTERVIRSEIEYYTGRLHGFSVDDNYVYDVPMVDSLFRPNATKRSGTQH